MKRIFNAAAIIVLTLVYVLALPFIFPGAKVYAAVVEGLRSAYGQGGNIGIEYTFSLENGVLNICVTGARQDVSVGLSRDDKTYNYRLKSGETAALPLNHGSGRYGIDVRVYVRGNEVEPIWKNLVDIELENELAPWLSASKIINWNGDMPLVKTAEALKKVDAKATALELCSYIAAKYTYDNEASPSAGYIPDLLAVSGGSSGMCYDFAALYTAMCRSVGIPCKLAMGYSDYIGPEKYHAWCLVYIDGQWNMIDPSYSLTQGSVFLDPAKTRISNLF